MQVELIGGRHDGHIIECPPCMYVKIWDFSVPPTEPMPEYHVVDDGCKWVGILVDDVQS